MLAIRESEAVKVRGPLSTEMPPEAKSDTTQARLACVPFSSFRSSYCTCIVFFMCSRYAVQIPCDFVLVPPLLRVYYQAHAHVMRPKVYLQV